MHSAEPAVHVQLGAKPLIERWTFAADFLENQRHADVERLAHDQNDERDDEEEDD
jgi:hypothetical protein